jgi:hypothetical protein
MRRRAMRDAEAMKDAGCRIDVEGWPPAAEVHSGEGGMPVCIHCRHAARLVVREDAGDQLLVLRVGPVWDWPAGGDGQHRRPEPGIWVEYQERAFRSDLMGPVLITPAVWRQLTRLVNRRLAEDRPLWRRFLSRLAGWRQ